MGILYTSSAQETNGDGSEVGGGVGGQRVTGEGLGLEETRGAGMVVTLGVGVGVGVALLLATGVEITQAFLRQKYSAVDFRLRSK